MRPFSLLVKPASADCNLRCAYCFYLAKGALYPAAARHRMPDEVLRRLIESYLATEQPQHNIGWQGGEPTLMGLEFFQRVTAYEERFGGAGKRVSNGLQTNATLLDDEWAAHLARYNFLVGVSLDGPAALHDRYRVHADGRGTHAEVLEAVARLRRHRVAFNVLTLVSQANVRHGRDVYRYLRDDLGVQHHQYIECVEQDADGVRLPFAVSGAEWGEFLCQVFDAWVASGDTRRVSVRLFESIVARLVDGTDAVCAMGRDCRHYVVVEHNGDVYPCDFFVEPALKLGNILDTDWEALLASPVYAAFGARKREWASECATCEHLSLCAGCCPKNRIGRGGRPGAPSLLCEGWRRFFAHTREAFGHLAAEVRREREAVRERQARQQRASVFEGHAGRNDPCPCGSGLKFKRCCGRA